MIGDRCGAHTLPFMEIQTPTAHTSHEACTSKISEEQLFYCQQRGLKSEDAVVLIVNGFCKSILQRLPLEFVVEAKRLLEMNLEGCVG